jgi:uncharacterized protein YozE (UPF0346 family)
MRESWARRKASSKEKGYMEKKTFYAWMMAQRHDNTANGDVARDMKADYEISKTAKTLAYYQKHLKSMGACDAALHALDRAWAGWEKYQSRMEEVGAQSIYDLIQE